MDKGAKICRICAKSKNKYIETNGIHRKVIFELIELISGLDIIDDERLPTSICCECSTQLQQAKSILDELKTAPLALNTKSGIVKCRSCCRPVDKGASISVYDGDVRQVLGKYLYQVIDDFVQRPPNNSIISCRSCCTRLCSYTILRDNAIASNEKFTRDLLIEAIPEVPNEPVAPESPALSSTASEDDTNIDSQIFVEEFQVIEDVDDLLVPIEDEIAPKSHEDELMPTEDVFVEPLEEIKVAKKRTAQVSQTTIPTKRRIVRKFQLEDVLTENSTKHHTKEFKCLEQSCNLKFLSTIERDYHMKISKHVVISPSGNFPFKCYCDELFATSKARLDHITKTHNCKFLCNTCEETFISELHLKKHIQEAHFSGHYTSYCLTRTFENDKSEGFSCAICKLTFATFDGYKEHCQFSNQEHNSKSTSYFVPRLNHISSAKLPQTTPIKPTVRPQTVFIKIQPPPPPAAKTAAKKGTSVLKLDTGRNSNGRPLIKIHKNLFLNNPQLLMRAKVMVERTFLPKNVTTIKVLSFDESRAQVPSIIIQNGLKIAEVKSLVNAQPTAVTIPKVHEPIPQLEPLNLLTIKEEVVVEPPVTQTVQNLDPNCEIVGDRLICRSCSLGMRPSHHFYHIKSKLHRLLLKFPLFRPKKVTTPRRLFEGKIRLGMKALCDPCGYHVLLSAYQNHVNSPRHKLNVKNPRQKLNVKNPRKKKEKFIKFNYKEDFSIEFYNKGGRRRKYYICDYCRQKFYHKWSLESHVKQHCSYDLYNCPFCDEKFCSKKDFYCHRKATHQTAKRGYHYYICKECKFQSISQLVFISHLNSTAHLNRVANNGEDNAAPKAKKKKTYKCLICNTNYAFRQTYDQHCALFHNDKNENEKIDLNCKLCNKEFPNPNDINIHYLVDHDCGSKKGWSFMSSKMLTCHCGEVMQRKVFRCHQRTKHPVPISFRIEKNENEVIDLNCKLCKEEVFSSPNDLNIHYLVDHDNGNKKGWQFMSSKMITCQCGEVIQRVNYRRHHKAMHPSPGLCHICGKNFDCLKKFRRHRDTAHRKPEKKLICDICGFRCATVNRMRRHMPKHDPNRVKSLCCEYCAFQCDPIWTLTRHMWRVHGVKKTEKICKSPVPANFHCDICDKRFVLPTNFETHLKSVDHRKKLVDMESETKIDENENSTGHEFEVQHSTEKNRHQGPIYVCDCCNKTFGKKSSLESHVKCHKTQILPHVIFMPESTANFHEIEEENVDAGNDESSSKCLICNINFPSQGDYVTHCASLHIKNEDFGEDRLKLEPEIDVVCKVCSRDFFDANDLNVHYVMDHEVKAWPFMSDKMLTCHCGEIIPRSKFKIHHRNKHQMIYPCDVCMKEFDSIEKFRRHRVLAHEVKQNGVKKRQKNLICDICGYENEKVFKMRKHMVVHDRSRLKKLKCDFCSYRCDYPYSIVRHLKTHGVTKTLQDFYERKKPVQDTQEKFYPYECELCDRKYMLSSKYRLHLKSKEHQDKIVE